MSDGLEIAILGEVEKINKALEVSKGTSAIGIRQLFYVGGGVKDESNALIDTDDGTWLRDGYYIKDTENYPGVKTIIDSISSIKGKSYSQNRFAIKYKKDICNMGNGAFCVLGDVASSSSTSATLFPMMDNGGNVSLLNLGYIILPRNIGYLGAVEAYTTSIAGRDDTVYCLYNNAIRKFNLATTANSTTRFAIAPGALYGNVAYTVSMCTAPDGKLYAINRDTGYIGVLNDALTIITDVCNVTAGFTALSSSTTGFDTDGVHFWVKGYSDNKIRKFTLAGAFVSEISQPAEFTNSNSRGLAVNNGKYSVIHLGDSGLMYTCDETGSLVKSTDLSPEVNNYGYNSAECESDSRVFIQDGLATSKVVVFDKQSGAYLQKFDLGSNGAFRDMFWDRDALFIAIYNGNTTIPNLRVDEFGAIVSQVKFQSFSDNVISCKPLGDHYYASAYNGSAIYKFDRQGNFISYKLYTAKVTNAVIKTFIFFGDAVWIIFGSASGNYSGVTEWVAYNVESGESIYSSVATPEGLPNNSAYFITATMFDDEVQVSSSNTQANTVAPVRQKFQKLIGVVSGTSNQSQSQYHTKVKN